MPRRTSHPAPGTALAKVGERFAKKRDANVAKQDSIRAQLDAAERACRCPKECSHDVREYVASEVRFFRENLSINDLTLPGRNAAKFHIFRMLGGGEKDPRFMRAALVALNPGAVEKLLVSVLEERLANEGETLATPDREETVEKLRADLDKLERDEERMIREAEREGLSPARRANARPDLVLASTLD